MGLYKCSEYLGLKYILIIKCTYTFIVKKSCTFHTGTKIIIQCYPTRQFVLNRHSNWHSSKLLLTSIFTLEDVPKISQKKISKGVF